MSRDINAMYDDLSRSYNELSDKYIKLEMRKSTIEPKQFFNAARALRVKAFEPYILHGESNITEEHAETAEAFQKIARWLDRMGEGND